MSRTCVGLRDEQHTPHRLTTFNISVRCSRFGQREHPIDHDLELAACGLIDQSLDIVVYAISGDFSAQENAGDRAIARPHTGDVEQRLLPSGVSNKTDPAALFLRVTPGRFPRDSIWAKLR